MTTPEITLFIQRLMRRELLEGELSALTTRDLDDINTYLAERAKAGRNLSRGAARLPSPVPRTARTYSEEEILLELGALDQA